MRPWVLPMQFLQGRKLVGPWATNTTGGRCWWKMRVAVVGAGVSGLAAAHALAEAGGVDVVLYEKEDHLGGHAKTVTVDGVDVDLGFMVFNRVTYPNMMEFFEGLGVDMETSDMSFSVSLDGGRGYEWGSRNGLASLFAQKTNALNPSFWNMIREIIKFKDDVLKYLEDMEENPDMDRNETLGHFIKTHGYSELFQRAYLIPICGSMWSCPSEVVMSFSAFFILSFCRNHYLLQLFNRPQWLTVKDRSHSYVRKVREKLESRHCQIRMGCAVQSITSTDGGCSVVAVDGSREIYDKCIIAVHAPDALKILGNQVTYEESRVLGAFQYVHCDIFLHRDKKLMPCNQSAWSAWNFLGNTSSGVCLTYWLNALQNLDSGEPFLVTLNPSYKPMNTLLTWSTSHPVPSVAASKALLELEGIQGNRGVWFCGAYQGYGFHEDGLKAGILAAHGVLGNKYALLQNNKYMVPSLMETGARAVVTRFLGNFISTGYLTLLEDGGTIYTFGRNNDPISYKSVLKVHNPIFYWKIATQADLGLADAYINGDCSFVDNKEGLLQLFMIFIANRDKRISPVQQMGKRGWWTPLLLTAGVNSARYFLRHLARKNTLTQARQNVSQHYDLSNDFFSLFLDDTMSYSCALFKDDEEDLKIAQLRKISLLIEKARIDAKHEILEIGCGWGTLAVEVVKQTGCRYTGITLSEKQLKFAKKKVKEAGLQDHINFLLCDYRQLSRSQKYDRIISCEMIEAVGHEYFEEFFGCCESILAEDGVVVMQFISIPDERYDEYRKSSDFIKEYIFPGGCLPSLSRITTAMSASSRLCVEHLENIGPHYYKTLIKWRNNFSAKKSEIVALGFDEKFIRTWEYYFIYCAAGFRTRTLGNYQVVFSRPGNLKAFSGLSKVLPSVDLHSLDSEGAPATCTRFTNFHASHLSLSAELKFLSTLASMEMAASSMSGEGKRARKEELVARISAAKKSSGKSYGQIAAETGLTNVFVGQLLRRQAQLSPRAAPALRESVTGLTDEMIEEMMTPPLRSYDSDLVKDPCVYRLNEAVMHFGESIKEIINEEFGDGIMSAIDFYCSVDKVKGVDGKDRVVITFDGKYLPYAEQMSENMVSKLKL